LSREETIKNHTPNKNLSFQYSVVGLLIFEPISAEIYQSENELFDFNSTIVDVHIGKKYKKSECFEKRFGQKFCWSNQKLTFSVEGEEMAKIYVYDEVKRKNRGFFGEGMVKLWNLYSHMSGMLM